LLLLSFGEASKPSKVEHTSPLLIHRLMETHDMQVEDDAAELTTTTTTTKPPPFPLWEKALRVFAGRRSTLTALAPYLVALAVPILLTGIALQYDVHLDTGITSFRARDEPTAKKQVSGPIRRQPTPPHARPHQTPTLGLLTSLPLPVSPRNSHVAPPRSAGTPPLDD